MGVIKRKDLVAKNKAGTGIRQKENNDAIKALADILEKVGKEYEDEALELSCNAWSKGLRYLTDNKITSNNVGQIDNALRDLRGMEEAMVYRDSTGQTTYDDIVRVLPKVGSSKEEFDRLLGVTNTVLELGLEKSILDPQAQARARQEQERRRQEQERQRQERERQRQEQERQEQERRRQQEAERRRREEAERQRREEEEARRQAEENARRQAEEQRRLEEQRRQQRVNELRSRREAFLREDYVGTDYANPEVQPLKVDPAYQRKLDALDELQRLSGNENILEHQRQEALDEAYRILDDDPIARRRREREEAALLAEEDAKNAEPIRQTKSVMISQELRDSFLKRYPPSEELIARDSFGHEIKGTDDILYALAEERGKLYIEVPDDEDHRCMCLEGQNGHLYISNGPVGYQSGPDLNRADPDPTVEGDFEALFNENGIESAVDADGRVLKTKEEMLEALEQNGSRIMVFGKDMAFAIALENRDRSLCRTEKSELQEVDPNTVSPDRVPEKTTLLGLNQDDILYAELPDGRRLISPEEIRKELRNPGSDGRLYLYTNQDPDSAYLVRYRHGDGVGMSPYLIHKSELAGTPNDVIEPMLMSEVEEKRILNWKEEEISHAVDEQGRRYETPEAIKLALYGADKTLQIYTKGEELPFAVQKKNNRFFISPERVPAFEDQFKALGEQLGEMDVEDFTDPHPIMDAKAFLGKNWTVGEPGEKEKLLSLTGMDFSKPQIDFAVDNDGKLYKNVDEIAALLDRPDDRTLYVFDKSGEPPYAVEKKDGMFYRSDDRISTRNILQNSESFEPKKSLRVSDIVQVADKSQVFKLKEQTDDLGKEIKFYEKNIQKLKDASEKPKAVKKPVKPGLGFWGSIAYGLTWFFTAGRGDTEKHKALPARRKRYQEDLALYPSRVEEYNKKLKAYQDYQNGGTEKIAEYETKKAAVTAKRTEVKDARTQAEQAHTAAMRGNDEAAVNAYRSKIETRLEGINDLRNRGVITPQNIFAHTWLKQAECRGKKASDPAARKAFCAYVAASRLEEEILRTRVHSDALSDPAEERKLQGLNNGSVVDAMMKDKDLQAMFDEMGDKAIDPAALKDAYLEKVAHRELEKKDPIKYLEESRAHMVERFGTLKVDRSDEKAYEKTFETVLRYKLFDTFIRAQNSLPPTQDPARIEARFDAVKEDESNVYRNRITEEQKLPYRKAFEALDGQELRLDQMSAALDAKKRELDLAAEGPQAHA